MGQPRILFIDIETAPIIMAAWQIYEANAVYVLRDTYIGAVAYKWLGERRAKSVILPDFPRYKINRHCDRDLCGFVHGLLNEADIVIAHNGDAFDVKKINSRLLVHKFTPPDSYKTIDTLKAARKHFKFDSNKLDNLGRYLSEGRKIANTGGALWEACFEKGDRAAWEKMRAYNRRDVDLDAAVYERLKPWMTSHPNLNLYTGHSRCPTCQSGHIQRKGLHYSRVAVRQRFLCIGCGAQWSGEIVKPEVIRCGEQTSRRLAAATEGSRPAHSRSLKRTTSATTRSTGRGRRSRASER